MIAEEQVSEKLTDLLPEGQGLEQELNSLAHKWVEESLFVLLDSYKGFFKNAQTIFESNYDSIPKSFTSLGTGRIRKIAFRTLED
ncbi:MAG: hypothetical protein AAGD28_29295, partial [Bacteroidota bacterium]